MKNGSDAINVHTTVPGENASLLFDLPFNNLLLNLWAAQEFYNRILYRILCCCSDCIPPLV